MTQDSGSIERLIERGYRYAYSLTHDAADAEDLLQEAWVSVLRAGGRQTAAYLFTAIRCRFIDSLRARKQLVRNADEFQAVSVTAAETCVSEGAEPLWENGELGHALGKLDAESRSMLFLVAVEGWSTRQIAKLMGIPRGTVLSRLHRTRARLRTLLQGKGDT